MINIKLRNIHSIYCDPQQSKVIVILNYGLYLHIIIRPRFCLTIMEFCKNAAYLQRTVKTLKEIWNVELFNQRLFCHIYFPFSCILHSVVSI